MADIYQNQGGEAVLVLSSVGFSAAQEERLANMEGGSTQIEQRVTALEERKAVVLSDAVNSTSSETAASSMAVKTAYDAASAAQGTAVTAQSTADDAHALATTVQETADGYASELTQRVQALEALNPVRSINGAPPDETGNVALEPGFAAGTVMLFAQAAAPTGWTKQGTVNDAAIRVVSGTGGGTGGSVAFSTAFTTGKSITLSGNVGATTLSVAQMPSHTHYSGMMVQNDDAAKAEKAFYGLNTSITSSRRSTGGSGNTGYAAYTSSTGSSGSHTHSLSGSASVNLAVKYLNVIVCTKN